MRNAIQSSLPEVLINRTSYYLGGRLKFPMLECRKIEKVEYPPGSLGDFWFFNLLCVILGWGDSSEGGGSFDTMLVRSGVSVG